jgi:hypothetical protein
MRTFALLFGVFGALLLQAETPQAAARAIHQLIQAENYAELFPTRYSEWYKFEQQGIARDQAIAQLARGFQAQRALILSVYSQLAKAEFELRQRDNPQISENGKIATASVKLGDKEMPFTLYQMKNGLWGFHQ